MSQVLASLGLAFAAVPLTSRPGEAAATGGDLLVFEWSGYDAKQFIGSYIKKDGAPPQYAFFSSQEAALEKVRAGYKPDIMHPCTTKSKEYNDAGILKPLDTSKLTHWNELWPRFRTMKGVVLADGKTYLAPFDWGNTSMCYRTDVFGKNAEETWQWLFDPKYKGRIAMEDGTDSIAAAALAMGIKDPYTMPTSDLAKVKQKLIDQKPLVRFNWTDQSEIEQALANHEIDIALCWNSAAVNLQKQGVPVKFAQPKEGIITWVCGLVHTNVGHADDQLAYDFIDSMLSPQAGAWLISQFGYGHSNQKAFDLVPKQRLEQLGLSTPSQMIEHSVLAVPSPVRDLWDKAWENVKLGA